MRILKKILTVFATLWGVATVIFFLFSVMPGDPAQMMLGQNENSEELSLIRKKYGFDQPLFKQYSSYLNDLNPISWHPKGLGFNSLDSGNYSYTILFDFQKSALVIKWPYLRESYQKNDIAVNQIIADTLPNTIVLAISALLIAIFFGLFLGVLSAIRVNTWTDRLIQWVSTIGMSTPSFFSAILAAWIFGFLLQSYTGLNMTGSLYELDDMGNSYHISWKNLILPSLVLGVRPLAVVTQLMRNALLDEWSRDYVRTARAKGLTETQVLWRHVLKNALNPVVTALSGWFASMLAGAVFVEYIFGWNGIGKEIVNALNVLDVPVLMGSVLTVSFLFILINLLVDQIYIYLDPKIKST
jgi:peptide/nickel transport system permease protein